MFDSNTNRRRSCAQRRGTVVVLAAIFIAVMLGLVAMAIDYGVIVTARTQLQASVDASALAAVTQLPEGEEAAVSVARDFLASNNLDLTSFDDPKRGELKLTYGVWDADTRSFIPSSVSTANAMGVAVGRGDVPSFFGRIFGQSQYPIQASAIAVCKNPPRDIIMVLDLSGSMSSSGRIEALRNAAPTFIDVIQSLGGNDRVGVLGLSSRPDRGNGLGDGSDSDDTGGGTEDSGDGFWVNFYPPGLDEDFVKETHCAVIEVPVTNNLNFVRDITLSRTNLRAKKYGGGTGIGACIRDAVYYFASQPTIRPKAEKVIVFMTDGRANKPSGNAEDYAREQAAGARAAKIKMYTISLGETQAKPLMEDVANITGGKHFDCTGNGEADLTDKLLAAFRKAAIGDPQPILVD